MSTSKNRPAFSEAPSSSSSSASSSLELPLALPSNLLLVLKRFDKNRVKLLIIVVLITLGCHLSSPERDLTLLMGDLSETQVRQRQAGTSPSLGRYFYYSIDNHNQWYPTGHYKGNLVMYNAVECNTVCGVSPCCFPLRCVSFRYDPI